MDYQNSAKLPFFRKAHAMQEGCTMMPSPIQIHSQVMLVSHMYLPDYRCVDLLDRIGVIVRRFSDICMFRSSTWRDYCRR